MLEEKIENLDFDKIDLMDDELFDSVVKIGAVLGVEVKASDLTNEFLMELRNDILDNLEDCFEIKKK